MNYRAPCCVPLLACVALFGLAGCGDDGGETPWVIPLTLIAETEPGQCGNARTIRADASGDASVVAFISRASNLVAGDVADTYDAFVRDITSGAIECISVGAGGDPAGGCDYGVSIDSAGQLVVFSTSAALDVSDANSLTDVYLYDTSGASATLTRVSIDTGDGDPDGASDDAVVSADGSAVVFRSDAAGLIAVDTNGATDIFVCILSGTPSIERVSVANDESQSDGASNGPDISADGDVVAFASSATNLVGASDTNDFGDVFVRIRSTSATERVSVATGGAEGNAYSGTPRISADGRYVAFQSTATNLVTGDDNAATDIFVRDRFESGTTERVSVATGGGQANGGSYGARISGDGRYVLFSSEATNLVAGDTNGQLDMFLRDRNTGTTVRVNLTHMGTQETTVGDVGPEGFSGDGSMLLYNTENASVPNDSNGVVDSYMRPNPLAP